MIFRMLAHRTPTRHFKRIDWVKGIHTNVLKKEGIYSLGITQPRFNQMLKGKIEIFSQDALVNMATSAGMRVGLNIRSVTSVKVRSNAAHKRDQPTKRRMRA